MLLSDRFHLVLVVSEIKKKVNGELKGTNPQNIYFLNTVKLVKEMALFDLLLSYHANAWLSPLLVCPV